MNPAAGGAVSLTGQQAFALLFLVVLFGIMGFKCGTKRSLLYTLVVFAGEVMISDAAIARKIITSLNGAYFGVMLVLKGGLGALGTGDIETAKNLLKDVHPIFSLNPTTILILWMVLIAGAFALGSLKVFKGKPSMLGALLGGVLGYLIGLVVLPLPRNMPLYPWEIKLQGSGQVTKGLGVPSSSVKTLILLFILATIISAGLSLSPNSKK